MWRVLGIIALILVGFILLGALLGALLRILVWVLVIGALLFVGSVAYNAIKNSNRDSIR